MAINDKKHVVAKQAEAELCQAQLQFRLKLKFMIFYSGDIERDSLKLKSKIKFHKDEYISL